MIKIVHVNELYIDEINIKYVLADLDEGHVEEIKLSILERGLREPPIISTEQVLLVGRHRMEALRCLAAEGKMEKAWFLIATVGGGDVEMASMDEDQCRRQVPMLEQCEMLARHDQFLADSGRRTKKGRPLSFPDDVSPYTTEGLAKEMGLGKRSYQRRLSIVGKISMEARNLIRHTDLANSQRELEALARVPEEDRVAVAQLLAAEDEKVRTVAAAVHMLRRERAKADGPRFERSGEGYRIVHAEPADWAAIVEPNSVPLIVTYVPDATGDAPVWDTAADARYTDGVVTAHRQIATMAAQVLTDGGTLLVMIGSGGSDIILAAMRTHIDFVDSIPFLVDSGSGVRYRSVLWFSKAPGQPGGLR